VSLAPWDTADEVERARALDGQLLLSIQVVCVCVMCV